MASENTSIINLVGNVSDPTQMAQPDASTPPFVSGRQTELLTSEIHGKHYVANYRGKLFEVSAVNVIVPVIAASLASIFTLYNPPGSGVNMEITSATVANVAATTVVNVVGWYSSSAVLTSKGTFTTAGTVNSSVVQGPTGNKGLFYTSYAHSGTPTLIDIIGGYGATSYTGGPQYKFYDGQLILPPGVAMSIAMSTGVQTGLALEARWAEWPV